jgi:hypothetical protein
LVGRRGRVAPGAFILLLEGSSSKKLVSFVTFVYDELPAKNDGNWTMPAAFCEKTSKIWRKYGFSTETIYGGCDTDYWYQTKEKNKNQFVFCHVNHSTVRSALELTLQAFVKVFKNNNDVKLIIKDSTENETLNNYIKSFNCKNIEYIVEFWDSDQLRDLYSESHVTLNVLRSTSFGMPLLRGQS